MAEEKNEFKVVDRRASSGASSETEASKGQEKKASGEGFVMKDSPKAEAAPPPMRIDFSTLILSLATGALIHMGVTPDPMTKQTVKNLELARQNIDILEILQEKTKGNLSGEEAQLLENLLAEVRLRYIEASRK